MSVFPETPATLLVKLAAQVTGEDEANWVRFAGNVKDLCVHP